MNPLYNLGICCYSLAAKLIAHRNVKAGKMLDGQKETFKTLSEQLDPSARYLWVHAASLGEFEQGRPLIEKVRREIPGLKILLTFFSPSGYEVRKNYEGADIVCYLPFDMPKNAAQFVKMVRPIAAIFIKYEFWRNYLNELKRNNVPTYLVSAIFRPTQSFFKWWGGMMRQMLHCYTRIFVQDAQSKKLLSSIGVQEVEIAGDTRFDRVTDIMRTTFNIDGMDSFKANAKLTLVVGSSWEQDEEMYMSWVNAHPEVKCIIAPHEFNPQRIDTLRRQLGDGTALMSEIRKDPSLAADAQHIIVDCFGLLSSLYRYADVAYIGGGFGKGIHNINEAAVYGLPVIFGPKHSKFKEASDLIECGGGISVNSRQKLEETMDSMLDDNNRLSRGKSAGRYITSQLGATDRVFAAIEQSLWL